MNKSGIYIHVPFCKSKCYYCDFNSIASTRYINDYIKALLNEIVLRRNFIESATVLSIYFGGGTPSILSSQQITQIIEQLNKNFCIANNCEITIELNPEDVSKDYLKELKNLGVNRLSIGCQSFIDDELTYLGRRHDAQTAYNSVKISQEAGFDNISIDLIIGVPINSNYETNIKAVTELNVPHISTYMLTLEKNTILEYKIKKKLLPPIDEEKLVNFYKLYMQELIGLGYEHYEISNFCKNGRYSIHNTNYWNGVPYLGFGAGAHSFKPYTRYWNTPYIKEYCNSILNNKLCYNCEELSIENQFNEYIMTGLRTKNGIDLDYIKKRFNEDFYKKTINNLKKVNPDYFSINNNNITLTNEGKLWCDKICLELFIV